MIGGFNIKLSILSKPIYRLNATPIKVAARGQVWWQMPIILVLWEAEARELLDRVRQRLQ